MTGTRAFLALTGGEKVEQDYDEVTKKRAKNGPERYKSRRHEHQTQLLKLCLGGSVSLWGCSAQNSHLSKNSQQYVTVLSHFIYENLYLNIQLRYKVALFPNTFLPKFLLRTRSHLLSHSVSQVLSCHTTSQP